MTKGKVILFTFIVVAILNAFIYEVIYGVTPMKNPPDYDVYTLLSGTFLLFGILGIIMFILFYIISKWNDKL